MTKVSVIIKTPSNYKVVVIGNLEILKDLMKDFGCDVEITEEEIED